MVLAGFVYVVLLVFRYCTSSRLIYIFLCILFAQLQPRQETDLRDDTSGDYRNLIVQLAKVGSFASRVCVLSGREARERREGELRFQPRASCLKIYLRPSVR